MLKFEILSPDGSVSEIVTSEKTTIKVGKLGTNDLKITDSSVGPVHATIDVLDAMTCKVKDRGSIGGTYIGDCQVEKSKEATFSLGSVLRFGKVNVRVTSDTMSGAGAPAADAPAPAATNDVQAAVPANAAEEAARISAAQVAAAAAPKAAVNPAARSGFAGNKAAGGFAAATATTSAAPKKIIRKKRPVSFERRFLSEKCPSGNGKLEVALLWRGEVISLREYKNKPGSVITIGSRTEGNDKVDFGIEDQRLGGSRLVLINDGGIWKLHFSTDYDGFLVVDPKKFGLEKLMFRDARPNDAQGITVASVNGVVNNGALSISIDGMTRAKIQFGDVALLVHMSTPNVIVLPFFGGISQSMLGSFVASFLLHFSLFSVMLFATDRVDALMIDRILTTSRFAEALIQPPEEIEEEEEDKQDEEEPEDPVEDDSNKESDNEPTPFAANTPSNSASENSGPGMSRSEAVGVAQATGLLAQANAMNSMLAVGANLDNMDLDWSSFDANAAAASAGYGMGMVGGGGGGAAMGGFGAGGFGPGGRGGGGAVGAAARSHAGNLGAKGEGAPKMKALNPDVSGSLDKRVIQKVVRQHFGELRACYEKELAKVKGLNGRISVTWLISMDGNVASAVVTETTMKNKNVENCIANSIKHWRFPRPNGGAACKVMYPFVFESGGGDK